MGRPRVAVAGFQHETNTFAPFGTGFADFERADSWPALTRGQDVITAFSQLNIAMGGFLQAKDFELVPILWANAPPASLVTNDAFERITTEIVEGIAAVSDLGGILLDLHGAMVTETFEDAEAEILRRIRAAIGWDVPIVVSLDMHGNLTRSMVEQADAIGIYRTYPHVDMAETGRRCTTLLAERLKSDRPFHAAFRKLPFLVPLSAQHTGSEPFRSLYGLLGAFPKQGVICVDIAAGFPLADIHDCGPAIVAYGPDRAAVEGVVDRIYERFLAAEPDFKKPLWTPADAVQRAIRLTGKGERVVLADVQDNPGCGGTSDTTGVLRALVHAGARKAALGMIWDPFMAQLAHERGLGAEIVGTLGSRYGFDLEPFEARFRVEALSDGRVVGTGVMFGGQTMALGPMAQLSIVDEACDVRIVVSSTRFQCLDQALFRAVGIEPLEQKILALKSTVHFRADFGPIASEILLVESPGVNVCVPSKLPYRKLRAGVRL